MQRWLAGRWRKSLEDLLTDSLMERHCWLRAQEARVLLRETAARGLVPNQLWYIYVLETWLRHEQNNVVLTPTDQRVEIGAQLYS